MSLEAAAKELEKLEIRMQKNVDNKSYNGAEDEKSSNWWEGKDDGREALSQQHCQHDRKTAQGGPGGDNLRRQPQYQHLGAGGTGSTDTGGGTGMSRSDFELSFSGPGPGRRRQQQDEGSGRQTISGAGCATREGSPTRVHLRRTGSVEIEHGGGGAGGGGSGASGGGGGIYLNPISRPASTGLPSHGNDQHGVGATAAADGDHIPPRMNRFDHDSTNTSRDAAIAAGDGQNWSRGSSWRMSGLGGSSGGRSLRNTWGSSAVGGAGPAAGSVVAAAVRDGARLREWRTEADADLSDIKATMQRIDGGTSISASAFTGGPAYSAAGGNGGGMFGLEPTTGSYTSSSAAAAASDIVRSAVDTTTTTDFRDGIRSSNPTISGFRDRIRSSAPVAATGLSGGDVSSANGLYSSAGGDSARAMGWGASNGSKAVLSALRGLQDKIRKLESERDRAAVEAGTLRRQIAALQSEIERSAQVNLAGEQETRLASRLAYERLQADKNAADIRLCKAEEQKRLLVSETQAAKERSQNAEEARRVAEKRVATLEDRLLGLGRREEAETSAEARAEEQAARRRRDKNDQLKELKAKVEHMETSVSEEKSLRAEVENGLARTLAAKKQTERFLAGILKVNEELVKNAVGGGGGRAPAAAASKKAKTKTKRLTSSSKAAAAAGRSGKGKMPAAEPPLPPPPPPRHGGYVDSADFNVGTYTAKRAKTRARPVKPSKRRTTTPTKVAPCVACENDQHVLQHNATSQAKTPSSRTTTQKSTSVAAGVGVPKIPGVPFVGSGKAPESYNVVSAVSKALRTARKGRPRESLDVLYADVGAAVLDSASDVPFMFQQRQPSSPSPSLPIPIRRGKKKKTATGAAVGKDRRGGNHGRVRVTGDGRAVLNVEMPDVGSLNLDAEPLLPRQTHHGEHLRYAAKPGVGHWVEASSEGDGGEARGASLPEY